MRVGDGGRFAFAFQLGEVLGVFAGVAQRIARDVEVDAFAEPGDVGGAGSSLENRFVATRVGFGQGHGGIAEHRVDARRLVLLAAGVADFVPFAQHQARRVGLDQALGGGLAGAAFGRRDRRGRQVEAEQRAQSTSAVFAFCRV